MTIRDLILECAVQIGLGNGEKEMIFRDTTRISDNDGNPLIIDKPVCFQFKEENGKIIIQNNVHIKCDKTISSS